MSLIRHVVTHWPWRLRRAVDLDCRWCWKPIVKDYSS